jgi:hypothetical protein
MDQNVLLTRGQVIEDMIRELANDAESESYSHYPFLNRSDTPVKYLLATECLKRVMAFYEQFGWEDLPADPFWSDFFRRALREAPSRAEHLLIVACWS